MNPCTAVRRPEEMVALVTFLLVFRVVDGNLPAVSTRIQPCFLDSSRPTTTSIASPRRHCRLEADNSLSPTNQAFSRFSSHRQRWKIRRKDDDNDDDSRTGFWSSSSFSSSSSNNWELAATAAASALTIPASAIVLWSEWAIFRTGCGPVHLSDALERGSYLTVIATSSLFWLTRIVTQGRRSLADVVFAMQLNAETAAGTPQSQREEKSIIIICRLIQWAELTNALAVLGAFATLGLQSNRDARMDGLTGINVDMCRAARELDE